MDNSAVTVVFQKLRSEVEGCQENVEGPVTPQHFLKTIFVVHHEQQKALIQS
jgi:hypothetical protein